MKTEHDTAATPAQPIGIVATYNRGGSGEHNGIEPIGKAHHSLAEALPAGTLLYGAPVVQPIAPAADVSAPTDERAAFEASRTRGHHYDKNEFGAYLNPFVENDFSLWLENRASVPTGERAVSDSAAEAPKLSRILFGLCEGGGRGEDIDIYADNFQADDGDVYVYRAAELLLIIAAENRMLGALINLLETRLPAARAAAPVDSPIGPLSNWTLPRLYDLACRQRHEIREGTKCIERYQAMVSDLQRAAAPVSGPTDV